MLKTKKLVTKPAFAEPGLNGGLDLLIAELAELNKTLRAMTKWNSCGLPALPRDAKP